MPQIVPFVVTAITAVTSAVVAAGPLAVAAFNAANIIGAAALANEAFKAVQPEVRSSSTALEWNADPNAPNRFAFGRVGGAGNIIHNATYGPDKMFVGFVGVMSASGPIKSWQAFKADDAFVSFNAAGMAINTEYAGEMYLGRQRGRQPEPSYLPSPSGLKHGAAMPRWGASYKLSGKAAYMYTLAENSKRSAFRGKVPTGIHYIEGLYCYDPRFDSSYPGGTGPCRIDDPTTWVYSTNAYIHALNWNIGRWEGEARGFTPKRYGVPYASMKVGGIGATPEGIDFSGYVEAANVFDENAWASSAWPDAAQSKAAVLDSFLQAGGGIYAERQGKISCLHRAAPRTSVVTITADDTAGTIEYDTTTSLLERINTIRPEYWSEAHGWQMVATDEVTSDVWREEDGQGVAVTRSKGLAYNYVPQSKQARELAALQIAHTREGIRGTAPLRHYLDLEVGDCFTFEVPEAVLNGQKCIVLNVDPDLENDIINVTFASESDGKYAFAFGQADRPPPAPAPQPADNSVSPPLPGDWTITPRPPAPGGGQLPGFDLGGIVSNETATAIIVEYGPTATGPWTQAYQGPPTVTNIPIDGVQPGATYYIAVQYQRNQNYSERYVYGPYTAPDLIAGGLSPDAAQKLLDDALKGVDDKVKEAAEEIEKSINLDDVFNGQGDLAEAILKLGRGQSELQRIIETHTREGGVLVKSIVKVMVGELENAQGAIVEEARLSLERDRAEALLREALALQVDHNEIVFQSSISGLVTDLAAEVRARQDLGARVANAEGAIVNEATIRANQDGVWLQNFNLLGGRRGNGSGWVLNKATVDITDEGTLAQVLSGLRAVDGANSSSITTLSQASANQASQLLNLSNTVGGQTASISQLFQVMEGIGARWTVALDSNGTSTGLVADGQTRSWVFSGASLSIIDAGNGLSYVPATGRLKIVKGNKKTVLGAGNDLIVWAGNTSVADGAETVDNGDFGIGSGDAWFGGRTLSRPFDSGTGPDTPIVIPADTWTVIAETTLHRMREGVFMTAVSLEALVASSTSEGAISWVVESVNASGGDPVIVAQSGFTMTANIIPWTTGWSQYIPGLGRRSGLRRLRLSVAWRNPPTTGVTIRRARLWGLYTADVTSWP